MMTFVSFGRFLVREKEGEYFIPLITLKLVYSVYASQHCVALVLGATQTKKKIGLVACALVTIQRE